MIIFHEKFLFCSAKSLQSGYIVLIFSAKFDCTFKDVFNTFVTHVILIGI